MKRIIATGSVAALALVGFAGTASAAGPAWGKDIKETTGSTYGQLLNSVRDANHPSESVVFPSASGAKTFWTIHAPLFD
jgi:hypothetical protein